MPTRYTQDGPNYDYYNDPEVPQPYAPAKPQPVPKPTAPPSMQDIEGNWLSIAQQFGTGPSTQSNISGYAGGNAYRGNLQPLVDAYNQKYGANARVLGDDTVDFGDGRGPTDVITGAGNFWYSEPGGMPGNGAASGASGSGASGNPGGLNINVSGVNGAFLSNPQGVSDALIQQLQQRAQQSLSINPATDPIIAPQVAAYGAQQELARRNYLDNLAESSGPYATGAVQGANERTSEQAGQATAGMQAQLVANELQARRTEIQNALTEQGGLLTANQQLTLQGQLGALDAALKQLSINNQNTQFGQTLAFNTDQGNNYWNAVYNGLVIP